MRTGIANFTLDTGKCPRWLFERMVKLGRPMIEIIVEEFGPEEFIRRLADPVWFQSLGTVLAFDWNASGLTTVLCGALKEAVGGREKDLGVFVCGGKGRASRKTPEEIKSWSWQTGLDQKSSDSLVYNSKMAAKVDSALVQDGYQLYHHSFFFTKNGAWTVVQQGMNEEDGSARRYHWSSQDAKDLVCEPHSAISAQTAKEDVLNLVAKEGEENRQTSVELVNESNYLSLLKDLESVDKFSTPYSKTVRIKTKGGQLALLNLKGCEFKHHPVAQENFSRSQYLKKIIWQVKEQQPQSYEKLLSLPGVGAKTMRALALVGEVIYGADLSFNDPARYSFAHGGKDGTPYFVDRPTYDKTISVIQTLRDLVRKARIPFGEKEKMLKRLGEPF